MVEEGEEVEEVEEVDYESTMDSCTRKSIFGCGTLYVTVDTHNNVPTRIFIRVGKAGCCQRALLEAVGRLLTLALEYHVPVERVMRTLSGIRCDKGMVGRGRLSCMDAVYKELKTFIEDNDGHI